MNIDYEYMILNNGDEDNTTDECANCPHNASCNSQCMEVIEIYNSYINQSQEVKLWEVVLQCYLLLLQCMQFYDLKYGNQLEVLRMTYANNYRNDNHNIKWSVAVYIKKHFSLALGNALMNVLCQCIGVTTCI